MTLSLAALPPELIALISFDLSNSELKILRGVCAELCGKTLHPFGQRFFRIIDTDLSLGRLQRLQHISQSHRFREHVQSLVLCSAKLGEFGNRGLDIDHHGYYTITALQRRSEEHLPQLRILQQALLNGLTNCRSFRFIGPHDPMPTAYSRLPLVNLAVSDTIAIILRIVAKSGMPIKAMSCKGPPAFLSLTTFRVLCSCFDRYPLYENGLEHLQELSLLHSSDTDFGGLLPYLVSRSPNLQSLTVEHTGDEYPPAPLVCELSSDAGSVLGKPYSDFTFEFGSPDFDRLRLFMLYLLYRSMSSKDPDKDEMRGWYNKLRIKKDLRGERFWTHLLKTTRDRYPSKLRELSLTGSLDFGCACLSRDNLDSIELTLIATMTRPMIRLRYQRPDIKTLLDQSIRGLEEHF